MLSFWKARRINGAWGFVSRDLQDMRPTHNGPRGPDPHGHQIRKRGIHLERMWLKRRAIRVSRWSNILDWDEIHGA